VTAKNLDIWFREKLPEVLSYRKCYELLLLILEERPGTLIMNPSSEALEIIEDLADNFDLYLRTESSDKGLSTEGVFLARDEEKLRDLESDGRFYGLSDKVVGRFLGYPEDSIEYFSENIGGKSLESVVRRKARKIYVDTFYLEFICYVPKPTEDNIVEAIDKGKKRFERLEKTDLGNFYIEKLRSNPIYNT